MSDTKRTFSQIKTDPDHNDEGDHFYPSPTREFCDSDAPSGMQPPRPTSRSTSPGETSSVSWVHVDRWTYRPLLGWKATATRGLQRTTWQYSAVSDTSVTVANFAVDPAWPDFEVKKGIWTMLRSCGKIRSIHLPTSHQRNMRMACVDYDNAAGSARARAQEFRHSYTGQLLLVTAREYAPGAWCRVSARDLPALHSVLEVRATSMENTRDAMFLEDMAHSFNRDGLSYSHDESLDLALPPVCAPFSRLPLEGFPPVLDTSFLESAVVSSASVSQPPQASTSSSSVDQPAQPSTSVKEEGSVFHEAALKELRNRIKAKGLGEVPPTYKSEGRTWHTQDPQTQHFVWGETLFDSAAHRYALELRSESTGVPSGLGLDHALGCSGREVGARQIVASLAPRVLETSGIQGLNLVDDPGHTELGRRRELQAHRYRETVQLEKSKPLFGLGYEYDTDAEPPSLLLYDTGEPLELSDPIPISEVRKRVERADGLADADVDMADANLDE